MIRNFVKRSDDFFRSFRKTNENGFTLMEMVIAIPLIALTGGFLTAILGSSITTMNNNVLVTDAGAEVRKVSKTIKNSKTCYELRAALKEQKVANEDSSKNFTIKSVINNEDETDPSKCVEGKTNMVTVEAVRDSNSKTLFKTTVAKNIVR